MTNKITNNFDPDCDQCPRLTQFLVDIRQQYPDYFSKPVPAFGDKNARLCIVGLAPGMHGANATGRPFTGDHAGILLYQTLHKYGFASTAQSISADDGLKLLNCRITNAVKCLPPQNKPVGAEVNTCNHWLTQELKALPEHYVLVALGGIAHKAVIKALGLKQSDYSFGHGVEHRLKRGVLIDCYHCSRYNTQTNRLTTAMFEKVFKRAQTLLK
ncbi:MAG: uracil-DNA glycosylase [Gammaproteobacteria bacterium]|nr:uracil-DNA glycosylase [Gammaproteobacteria bacterium]